MKHKNQSGVTFVEFSLAFPFFLFVVFSISSFTIGLFNSFGAYYSMVVTLREIAVEITPIMINGGSTANPVMREMVTRLDQKLQAHTTNIKLSDIELTLFREIVDTGSGTVTLVPKVVRASQYSGSSGNNAGLPDILPDTFVSMTAHVKFVDFANSGLPPVQMKVNTVQRMQEYDDY